MFRELLRKKQALTKEECEQILIEEERGVLSVNGDEGYPYAMPMNHYYDAEVGALYFHQGKVGHRLEAIKNNDKVCFCVMDKGTRKECGWSFVFKSVIVFGRIEIVGSLEKVKEISYKLSKKFTSDEEYILNEIDKFAKNTLLLKLTIEHMSGKWVREE